MSATAFSDAPAIPGSVPDGEFPQHASPAASETAADAAWALVASPFSTGRGDAPGSAAVVAALAIAVGLISLALWAVHAHRAAARGGKGGAQPGAFLYKLAGPVTTHAQLTGVDSGGRPLLAQVDGQDVVVAVTPADALAVCKSSALSAGEADKWGSADAESGRGVVAPAKNLLQPMASGTFFHLPTGAEWRAKRKLVTPLFSLPAVLRATEAKAAALAEALPRGRPVDLQHELHELVRETMFVAALGRDPLPEETAVYRALAAASEAGDAAAEARLVGDALALLRAALPAAAPADCMASMMRGRVDADELARSVHNLVVAGAESSVAALARTVAAAAGALPEARRALLRGAGGDEDEAEAFAQAVVMEGLRRFAPATLFSRRCVGEPFVLPSGVVVQPGTAVAVCPTAIHLDAAVWPEPLKFDPERFVREPRPAPGTWLPFSHGVRACPGKTVGIAQSRIVLRALFRATEKIAPVPGQDLDATVPKFSVWGPAVEVVLS